MLDLKAHTPVQAVHGRVRRRGCGHTFAPPEQAIPGLRSSLAGFTCGWCRAPPTTTGFAPIAHHAFFEILVVRGKSPFWRPCTRKIFPGHTHRRGQTHAIDAVRFAPDAWPASRTSPLRSCRSSRTHCRRFARWARGCSAAMRAARQRPAAILTWRCSQNGALIQWRWAPRPPRLSALPGLAAPREVYPSRMTTRATTHASRPNASRVERADG